MGVARSRVAPAVLVAASLAALLAFFAPAASAAPGTITVTAAQVQAVEAEAFTGTVATFTDQAEASGTYTATVQWGDGSSTIVIVSSPDGSGTVTASHTYAAVGSYPVIVTVTGNGDTGSGTRSANVAGALTLQTATPVEFSAGGSSQTAAELAAFEGAIGGNDNGTAAGVQVGGYRHITWDAVNLDGGDRGSTTIAAGRVVAISADRVEPWGIELQRGDAVAGDGFASVNSSVTGRLTPYSAPNVFAPFNTNSVRMQVVTPASQGSAPAQAATRGLGVVFLNVHGAGTTIQYLNGNAPLGPPQPVPSGGQGQPSFAAELFPSPVVTNVAITFGTAPIFSFDGLSSSSAAQDGVQGADLVAADDLVLAEPVSAQTTLRATAGASFSATVDTFVDTNPASNASNFTALIEWGDGTQSSGTMTAAGLSAAGPGYNVSATHTYSRQGTFQAVVSVSDWGGSTQSTRLRFQVAARSVTARVSCSPSRVVVTTPSSCTAIVADTGPGAPIAPGASVSFASSAGGGFADDAGCMLEANGKPGQASCRVVYTPAVVPKRRTRILATYGGDGAHAGATGSARLSVVAQTCTVGIRSARLGKHESLQAVVTCDEHASAQLTVGVSVARNGSHPAARFTFALVRRTFYVGRRTITIVPSKATAARLAAAARTHQRISLKLSITATGITRRTTATATLRAVRVS